MAEVFTRTATRLAGAFSANTMSLAFSAGVSTALVQNLQASYQQAITRLFEIGNVGGVARVYYVGGRSQGSLNIGRVIGPATLMSAYYAKFGDVCLARSNSLRFALGQVDCSVAGAVARPAVYVCAFCVITQVGVSVAAADTIVNESSSLMFSGFDYTGP